MTILFQELRSPQIRDAAERGAVAVLPVGQTEEHGPHLPICTDVLIAQRVCEAAVERLSGDPLSYVLEPISYGYSQKVLKRWPGTFVLPQEIVIETLKHVVLSLADMGFRKVAVVSVHGNHVGACRVAARAVADACGMGPGVFFPAKRCGDIMSEYGKAGPGGSCHAGEFETAVLLHLVPELVDMSAVTDSDKLTFTSPYSSSEAFVSTWTIQESGSGVYGDPTTATAELGKRLCDKMVDETANFVRYYSRLKQV